MTEPTPDATQSPEPPQDAPAPPAELAATPPCRRRSIVLIAAGCFVAPILIAAAALVVWPSSGPGTGDLVHQCRAKVEDQLKAPATTRWPGGETIEQRGDNYSVDGTVDAENGFGALVRGHWTCTAGWRDGQWKWVTATVAG